MKIKSEILEKIAAELVSLKTEISEVKNQIQIIDYKKVSPEVKIKVKPIEQQTARGFFDEEEDEIIALTGDELDNIMDTAEITEDKAGNGQQDLTESIVLDEASFQQVEKNETEEILLDESDQEQIEESFEMVDRIEDQGLEPETEEILLDDEADQEQTESLPDTGSEISGRDIEADDLDNEDDDFIIEDAGSSQDSEEFEMDEPVFAEEEEPLIGGEEDLIIPEETAPEVEREPESMQETGGPVNQAPRVVDATEPTLQEQEFVEDVELAIDDNEIDDLPDQSITQDLNNESGNESLQGTEFDHRDELSGDKLEPAAAAESITEQATHADETETREEQISIDDQTSSAVKDTTYRTEPYNPVEESEPVMVEEETVDLMPDMDDEIPAFLTEFNEEDLKIEDADESIAVEIPSEEGNPEDEKIIHFDLPEEEN